MNRPNPFSLGGITPDRSGEEQRYPKTALQIHGNSIRQAILTGYVGKSASIGDGSVFEVVVEDVYASSRGVDEVHH